MADTKTQRTEGQAVKMLEAIQKAKSVPCMAFGVPSKITALDHNAFKISIAVSEQGALGAANKLKQLGADIRPWGPSPDGTVRAIATWDTALHYLAMPGCLSLADGPA